MHHKGTTPKNMKDFVLVFESTYGFDLYDLEVKAICGQLKLPPGAWTRFGLFLSLYANSYITIMNTGNAESLYLPSTSRESILGTEPSSSLPFLPSFSNFPDPGRWIQGREIGKFLGIDNHQQSKGHDQLFMNKAKTANGSTY